MRENSVQPSVGPAGAGVPCSWAVLPLSDPCLFIFIFDIVIYFQNYADGERGEVEHLLDEVSSSLDRIRSQVVGGIENQLGAVMAKGEGLVSRLEAELSQLMDRRATLEVQAISQDHIGFMQVRTEQI